MPDIDYSKYPDVHFRVSGELASHLTERGDNLNSVGKRDLERYYDALQAHLPTFTMNEALLLCDVLNGVICTPRTLWANVAASDSDVFVKWDVAPEPFLARLNDLSHIEALAVIDAVERAWNDAEYTVDLRKRVLLVGLVK